MIANELQYRVTQEQAGRLEAGLARLATPEAAARGISPELQDAERAGVRSVLATLYGEIAVYEAGRDSCEREPKRLPVWLRRSGWQARSHQRQRTPVHASHQRASDRRIDLVRLLDRAEAELGMIVPSDTVREEVEAALWDVAGLPEAERRRLDDSLGDWADVVRTLVDEGGD